MQLNAKVLFMHIVTGDNLQLNAKVLFMHIVTGDNLP